MMPTRFDRHVILIVDDMPDNLALLSDALDESGHIVLVATDGMQAMERLQRITPDLILLDAIMPGMDGFETCRRIKLLKHLDHVPVVFMTGLTETEHVVKGFQVGGIDYVTKPIRPQEIVARIGAHIRTARMMSQARGVIDAAANAVIVLNANGMPLWQSAKAAHWLEKYFQVSSDQACITKLPPRMQAWVNESLATAHPGEHAPAPLIVVMEDSELSIRLEKNARTAELTLLLDEKPHAQSDHSAHSAHSAAKKITGTDADPLRQYELTPRENDVMIWLAKGKTNRDIADILGMSPRTVNKHLEHIFIKLGVETRSAAVGMAIHQVPLPS
ncbi:response regulator transcription factor [Herbaspirillum sp. RTI4]|uniref:response regulator transcription factor n=1 Tax=Herbaspirillum sp. RTI4 TaxID=3048640 RepID=UPI002AB59D5D|nr:response regulator transcription factor [Herbaspirillum sp. RTI4]MDY7579197.1 response regulator transcription factor [Herbaspirillum sp. RTI4]MEA9983522.1 response regulator transcription factor [Herbaspirillum sp. RTI4]